MKNDTGPFGKGQNKGMAYPAFSLKTALERVKTIWDREKRNAVPMRVLAAHWERSMTSSGFHHELRTLSGYGLLSVSGMLTNAAAVCRLTERALKLLFGTEAEKAPLLKEAALSSVLHRSLWGRYGTDLPSEKSLEHALILEGYRPLFVRSMISGWRETMAFAGLDREAETAAVAEYSAPEEPEDAEQESAEEEEESAPAQRVQPPPVESAPVPVIQAAPPPSSAPLTPPAVAGREYVRIPLLRGEVPIPVGMAESEYHLLLHNLKVLKGRIVAV